MAAFSAAGIVAVCCGADQKLRVVYETRELKIVCPILFRTTFSKLSIAKNGTVLLSNIERTQSIPIDPRRDVGKLLLSAEDIACIRLWKSMQ